MDTRGIDQMLSELRSTAQLASGKALQPKQAGEAGAADFGQILQDPGKHRRGKACLYFNRLDDVDAGALRRLIRAGPEDLARHWPVRPSREAVLCPGAQVLFAGA